MKIRYGYVSNSSSSSFIVTDKKIEDLVLIKAEIERFLVAYKNRDSWDYEFIPTAEDQLEVEISTESSKGEQLLYSIFESVI